MWTVWRPMGFIHYMKKMLQTPSLRKFVGMRCSPILLVCLILSKDPFKLPFYSKIFALYYLWSTSPLSKITNQDLPLECKFNQTITFPGNVHFLAFHLFCQLQDILLSMFLHFSLAHSIYIEPFFIRKREFS